MEIPHHLVPHLPNYEILWISEVGSQMWKMADISSDHDLIVIYRESTDDILRGKTIHNTLPNKHHIIINGEEYDFSYFEIGHFCNQLKKGNINAIWAILSPLQVYYKPIMVSLLEIIYLIHTNAIVPSGVGMTESQLRDATRRAHIRLPEKSLKTAFRTIRFVHDHLLLNMWDFSPVEWKPTEEAILSLMDDVKRLSPKYNHGMPTDEIEEWLLNLRTGK